MLFRSTTGDIIYASSANTPARLGIGSSGQVLTVASGIPSWATAAGGGKVLQVVHASYSTAKTSTSLTFVDTGLTATITPSSASSKVLVIFSQNSNAKTQMGSGDGATLAIRLMRDSTELFRPSQADGYSTTSFGFRFGSISGEWLDSPNTTNAIIYKCQFANWPSATGEVAVNQNGSTSTMVLLEIGA